jgi:hypothetical protein
LANISGIYCGNPTRRTKSAKRGSERRLSRAGIDFQKLQALALDVTSLQAKEVGRIELQVARIILQSDSMLRARIPGHSSALNDFSTHIPAQ